MAYSRYFEYFNNCVVCGYKQQIEDKDDLVKSVNEHSKTCKNARFTISKGEHLRWKQNKYTTSTKRLDH